MTDEPVPDEPRVPVPPMSLEGADLDLLLRELLGRVQVVLDESARWELLLDAVVSMAADLGLDALLGRIVEIASRLVDARYAALGVLGHGSSDRLHTFVHRGMTDEQVREIGDLPAGHGLLGLLIDRPEPVRLAEISAHPASFGFPPGHPPMSSFLGVPLLIRERAFGNLYLTEKRGGTDFTDQDERIVTALAAAAGVAIENARLHEEAARRERWLAATAEIAALLSGATGGVEGLQAVADRAHAVAEADATWILVADQDERLVLRAFAGPEGSDPTHVHGVLAGGGMSREVLASGEPLVVPDVTAHSGASSTPELDGWPEIGCAVVVPLRGATHVEGTLGLGWSEDRREDFLVAGAELPARFAEQAALALEIARAREDRQRIAVFEDRDRIAQDLHDLVIQRLFAIGLSLQGARRQAPAEVGERLETAVDDLDATIRDIRRSIFALGAGSEGNDVQTEVTRLVDRAAETLKFRPDLTFEGPVRTLVDPSVVPDLLAVLREALSNASRHAGASRVEVVLRVGEQIVLEVADDGRGIPEGAIESGLRNIRRRAEQRHGHCDVVSPARGGSGTRLCWTVPFPAAAT